MQLKELLAAIPDRYRGKKAIIALAEKEAKRGNFPYDMNTMDVKSGDVREKAGITYMQLPNSNKGELQIGQEKVTLKESEYRILAYLGADAHFDTIVSSQKIAADLEMTEEIVRKNTLSLRIKLHVGLEGDMHRLIGSPVLGYRFTNPTEYRVQPGKKESRR